MGDEHHFETSGSGASATYPMQCSALRKNGHVVIKGRPCKISEMSTSKTGKHGHAKVHLVGFDIFTNKKLEDISPSTHNMDVPHVSRAEYTIIGYDDHDGYLNLMSSDGATKDDIKLSDVSLLPGGRTKEKFKEDIDEGAKEFLATVISAMGEEAVQQIREAPSS